MSRNGCAAGSRWLAAEAREHGDDEGTERFERAEALRADNAGDDPHHGQRDKVDDPVEDDDERLEGDADEVAEFRDGPVAHLAQGHAEGDRNEYDPDDFAIVGERAEQAARDVFEKLREHARLATFAVESASGRRGRQVGPMTGAEDICDEQADADGDERIQNEQADEPPGGAFFKLRGHQRMGDGGEDERGGERAEDLQDELRGDRERRGFFPEDEPGDDAEDEAADDPQVKRGAPPPGEKSRAR